MPSRRKEGSRDGEPIQIPSTSRGKLPPGATIANTDMSIAALHGKKYNTRMAAEKDRRLSAFGVFRPPVLHALNQRYSLACRRCRAALPDR